MRDDDFGFGLKGPNVIHVLLCVPVKDLADPAPGSIQAPCARCNEPVWVSFEIAKRPIPYRRLCPTCFEAAGYRRAVGKQNVWSYG